MYNIFIVGSSKSGKTPLANLISKALGMPVVSASDWARKSFKPLFSVSSIEDKQRYIKEITNYSIDQLIINPNICIDFIRSNYPDLESKKGFIIEGFRNPKDFLTFFNPKLDLVIGLDYPNNIINGENFEIEGLKLIISSVQWFIDLQIMNIKQFNYFTIDELSYEFIESLSHELINWAGLWFQECPV